jgi:hypothetical protein
MQTTTTKTLMIRILATWLSAAFMVWAVPACPDNHSCCEPLKQTCCTQTAPSNVPVTPPSGADCSCVDQGVQVASVRDVARDNKRQVRNDSVQTPGISQSLNLGKCNSFSIPSNAQVVQPFKVAVFRMTLRWRC